MDTKYCSCCKEELDVKLFFKNKSKKDGYDTICKKCRAEAQRRYREKQRHHG